MKKLLNWKIILGLQIFLSVILMFLIVRLGVLPTPYIIGISVLLLLLVVGMYFLMKPFHGEKVKRNVIGKVISILLSILMIVGCFPLYKGQSTIRGITGSNTQTVRFSLIVLKDSQVDDVTSLKEVSVNDSHDKKEHFTLANNKLHKQNNKIKINYLNNYSQLADDLYSGKSEAIFVNEAYNGMFEEKYPTFSSDTKVIWSFDITEEIESISKNVNVTEEAFNIYVSGIDTRGPVSTVSRSDVNMIVTVNTKTKQILLTSIPRDYYVTLDNKGKKDKLTHSGLGGINNTVKTVENFMGIDINYYARVNFTSLIKIVDALGGITVNSPVAFKTLHGKYQIVKGDNHMDGEMALGFVRERYGLSGGDNDRIKNQQRVLSAMLEKAISPAIITNYSNVLDSIKDSLETNFTTDELTSLIQMQINDMTKWEILQVQMSGHGKMMTGGAYMPNHKLYYSIPDEESIKKCSDLIKRMIKGEIISVK